MAYASSEFLLSFIPPASRAFHVTPHDTNLCMHETRGLYLGTSGSVRVDMADGDSVTFANLAAGIIHPLRVTRVYATGTNATGIVGVW
jgi:S-adenosylmethionine synthetase